MVRGVPGRSRHANALGAHHEGLPQDFDAIATLIVGEHELLASMAYECDLHDQLRTGFARYAQTHEAASIRRCWSTWNVLCT